MEEKEILDLIKGVVAESRKQDREQSDLEKARAEKAEKDAPEKKGEAETFDCPECGVKVTEKQKYCPGCGIELEWEE